MVVLGSGGGAGGSALATPAEAQLPATTSAAATIAVVFDLTEHQRSGQAIEARQAVFPISGSNS